MSRSKKGKKPCGWDYWGKRPIGMGDHGTKAKRVGLKKERAVLKKALSNESSEPDFHEDEIILEKEK